jgi:hypothetical protein
MEYGVVEGDNEYSVRHTELLLRLRGIPRYLRL